MTTRNAAIAQPLDQPLLTPTVVDEQGVLQTKRFVRGAMQFLSPAELMLPAIEILQGTDLALRMSGDNEMINANADGSKNVSYGRLNLIANCRIDEEMQYEFGILLALDSQIPKIKVYRGAKIDARLNTAIFGADDIQKFELSTGVNLDTVRHFISLQAEKIRSIVDSVNRLKQRHITETEMNAVIGHIFLHGMNKETQTGTQVLNHAVGRLADDKSPYYYKQENFNAWVLHNAFTDYFSTKKTAIFDIPEKTLGTTQLINQALNLN